ncbi:hypothetical protein KC19_9G073300 [Ceratodon purpureus]|uniref:Ribonuclease H n=1 Tax=Ceratodon purpureus TaxID=3225 RepID=A0A8T0GT64_CERPU|nr:hypothetical protein KC19_9G073300 [Ceratodon purpureus]
MDEVSLTERNIPTPPPDRCLVFRVLPSMDGLRRLSDIPLGWALLVLIWAVLVVFKQAVTWVVARFEECFFSSSLVVVTPSEILHQEDQMPSGEMSSGSMREAAMQPLERAGTGSKRFNRWGRPIKRYYAVRRGIRPGVYSSWGECAEMVIGFKGAIYKGFETREEAVSFVGLR